MSEEGSSPPGSRSVPTGLSSDAAHARSEIELFATESLARFGAPGTLRVEGAYLVLYAPQGVLRVELDGLDERWASLGEETRRKRTADLVRRLMSRRSLLPTPPPRQGAPAWIWPSVVVAAALAAWAAYAARPQGGTNVIWRAAAAETPQNAVQPAVGSGRAERAARVCDSARARVLRGATLGPTETEGWVVDILLLSTSSSKPLHQHPALEEFVSPTEPNQPARFVWSEEPELSALDGIGTNVSLAPEVVNGESGTRAGGVRITFYGRLVDIYFRPEERSRYFHIASSLSDRLEATLSAVFARCEGGHTHHLGSWFRGDSPGTAAAALLYLIGTYAEPPHLADPFLRPIGTTELDRATAWDSIFEAAEKLDQRSIAALLGGSGGMITSISGGGAAITFPFTDGNRASRASRQIARAVHLGRP